MAAASYDQLLKQVEALKMENSNLRQELEDNSNHLTKLETEASNMKVLQLCACMHLCFCYCLLCHGLQVAQQVFCAFRFLQKSFSRLCKGKKLSNLLSEDIYYYFF